MRNTSYCELWGNMSRERWAVNIMQMRHAGDLLLISCPNLIKISCFKGLRWKIYVKEDLATENENIENRKINEQHKFSLDADSLCGFYRNGTRLSTVMACEMHI